MPIMRRAAEFRVLSSDELAVWREVAPAIAGDAMNRSQCMQAAIKPLAPGTRLCGQARTVQAMVGDNGAIHAALSLARPGEVMVVDAGGHVDTAVWGEVMTVAAQARGLAGAVLDGATRDAARIRELGFAMFARGIVPRGPHKGFGGVIDGPIAAGGVPVGPGDLVLGDDDGVCVVPLSRIDAVFASVLQVRAREQEMMAALAAGRPSAEIVGVTVPLPSEA